MLPQYLFLLLSQLVNLGFQAYSTRRLRSLARQEQLLQARAAGPAAACCCGVGEGLAPAAAGSPAATEAGSWGSREPQSPPPPRAGVDAAAAPALMRAPLLQEQTKAWRYILLDIAVMVCVLLSDPSLPHAPSPLPTLVVTSFLAVLDMVRWGWGWPSHGASVQAGWQAEACRPGMGSGRA